VGRFGKQSTVWVWPITLEIKQSVSGGVKIPFKETSKHLGPINIKNVIDNRLEYAILNNISYNVL